MISRRVKSFGTDPQFGVSQMVEKTEIKNTAQGQGAGSLKLVEGEIHAHAMRNKHLVRDIVRNVPWAILIGTMDAELRGAELSIDEVATGEDVPVSLALRWARALSDQGLIFVRENSVEKIILTLQPKGSQAMAEYLSSLEMLSGTEN